jgi:hypothetical protein
MVKFALIQSDKLKLESDGNLTSASFRVGVESDKVCATTLSTSSAYQATMPSATTTEAVPIETAHEDMIVWRKLPYLPNACLVSTLA